MWGELTEQGRWVATQPLVRKRAKRLNADLIVMASHGRAGLDALLAGSVAPRITSRANRPLLLVRANVESA